MPQLVMEMAERRLIEAPTILPGGGLFERLPRFRNTDADRAAAEYRFSNPYADLQDFLLEQPVFDRDPIRQPSVTTGLTRLDRPDFSEGDIKQRFTDVFERQRAIEKAQEDARAKAISDLRDELAKETASAADAAAQSRSELTQTLEGRIAEAREAASQEVADQATVIEDLQGRIGSLTQDLGGISKTISEEQAKLSAELRESQKGAVDLVQGRIDGLTDELKAVSDSVGEEAIETTNNLRNEREQIVGNLESQITALKDQVDTLPVDQIQARIAEISEQSENFVASASEERAALAQQIAALEEQGVTQEDLSAALSGRASLEDIERLQDALSGRATVEDLEKFRGDYQATGRLVEEALQTGQKQRQGLQERIQALQEAQLDPANIQQERQTAITTALDPIQAQLQQIQGSIPQQIDVEALRQQITADILGQIPQGGVDPNVSAGVGAGGVPYTGGSTGVNVSDGMADQTGLIPGGSVQDQIDFADNYQGRGGTRPAAPAAAPQVAVAPPPQVAATTPSPVAVAPPPAVTGGVAAINPAATQAAQAAVVAANQVPPAIVQQAPVIQQPVVQPPVIQQPVMQPPSRLTPRVGLQQYGRRR
jgi:DNA repair exonuclease SbcCD ATPase subunit